MNQHTADNRPASGERRPVEARPMHGDPTPTDSMPADSSDPLEEVADALEWLPDVDPAESVAVLADITAALNRAIDSDQEGS